MTRVRVALVALVLSMTVLVTGCAQAAPNTAAIINGVVVRETTIDDLTDGIMTASPSSNRAKVRVAVVNAEVYGELATQIAAQKGITLTDADVTKMTDGTAEVDALLSTKAGYQYATQLWHWSEVATTLGTTDAVAVLKTQDVRLNPRYGSWATYSSAETATDSTGSLSEIAGS